MNIEGNNFVFRFKGTQHIIPLNAIKYFESSGRKIIIHTLDQNLDYYDTLANLSNKLSPFHFVRCHQSYIVNAQYVTQYTSKKLNLEDCTLTISRKYKEQAIAALTNPEIGNNYGKIICTKGHLTGATYLIKPDCIVTIGRSQEDCDIAIPLAQVSREHCEVIFDLDTNSYRVRDNSTNGTFFQNGIRLARGDWYSVQPGQILFFGSNQMEYSFV